MLEDVNGGQPTSGHDLGAIDVTALMEQVKLEVPRGTITVHGTVEALRTSPKDPAAIYGDLRGFDRSMMSFRCPVTSGLRKEQHVVLRGTLISKRSTIHRGFDLELTGSRVGTWTPSEPVSDDQRVLERTTTKTSLERLVTKDAVKRLVLIGTKTGIEDAKTALSRVPGQTFDQLITPTTLEHLLPVIVEAAKKYDGFCLVRGGGDANSFADWNDRSLIEVLIRSGKPFYTALGHASDVTLADKHADESFATPTGLGAAYAEAWQARTAREQLERRIQNLSRTNRELKAASESAKEDRFDRQVAVLQTTLSELQKLPTAIAKQTRQALTEAARQLRFQTRTWLFSMFFFGVAVGGLSLYTLEKVIDHRARGKPDSTQQPASPGAKPYGSRMGQTHRER